MICLKIRTFVVSATTKASRYTYIEQLWFAWKFVPLWYQQQPSGWPLPPMFGCDLLENSYLCGISNNIYARARIELLLWFAWKFVPLWYQQQLSYIISIVPLCCDLLENSYLCGISNNILWKRRFFSIVVICLKIRTFVVSATTAVYRFFLYERLWFAWKFVPLWYQQQLKLDNLLVSIEL